MIDIKIHVLKKDDAFKWLEERGHRHIVNWRWFWASSPNVRFEFDDDELATAFKIVFA